MDGDDEECMVRSIQDRVIHYLTKSLVQHSERWNSRSHCGRTYGPSSLLRDRTRCGRRKRHGLLKYPRPQRAGDRAGTLQARTKARTVCSSRWLAGVHLAADATADADHLAMALTNAEQDLAMFRSHVNRLVSEAHCEGGSRDIPNITGSSTGLPVLQMPTVRPSTPPQCSRSAKHRALNVIGPSPEKRRPVRHGSYAPH